MTGNKSGAPPLTLAGLMHWRGNEPFTILEDGCRPDAHQLAVSWQSRGALFRRGLRGPFANRAYSLSPRSP